MNQPGPRLTERIAVIARRLRTELKRARDENDPASYRRVLLDAIDIVVYR